MKENSVHVLVEFISKYRLPKIQIYGYCSTRPLVKNNVDRLVDHHVVYSEGNSSSFVNVCELLNRCSGKVLCMIKFVRAFSIYIQKIRGALYLPLFIWFSLESSLFNASDNVDESPMLSSRRTLGGVIGLSENVLRNDRKTVPLDLCRNVVLAYNNSSWKTHTFFTLPIKNISKWGNVSEKYFWLNQSRNSFPKQQKKIRLPGSENKWLILPS